MINFDDILTEWSYRIPKGYPTIVDGQFVDRDEVIILNQILEEKGLETMELPEAKPTTKTKSKSMLQPTAFANWWNGPVMKSATNRTKFFELIPIVQALQPNKPVTVKSLLDIIDNNSDLDWGDIDFITNQFRKFLKSKDTLTYLDKYYLAGNSPESPIPARGGMVSIFNNKPITSFMWNGVRDFYKILDNVINEKNKAFTADVILFWGVDNPFSPDIVEKIKKAVKNPTIVNDSVVKIGNNQYMACVSLKAGEGRIGKLTSYLSPEASEDDVVSEGFFGNLAGKLQSMAEKIGGKLGELWEKAKSFLVNLTDRAKKAFSNDSPSIQDANKVSEDLVELFNTVKEDNPDFTLDETLQEIEGDSIICTTCIRDKILAMEPFINKFATGAALNDFDKKIKELSSQPGFVYKFEKLDTKKAEIKKGADLTKRTVDRIKKAKPTTKIGPSTKGKCVVLDLNLKRSEMKNIFFINANQNAITSLTRMLDNAFPKGISKSKNVMDTLLKLAVDLNAQSIFGKSGNLPLVKFTGEANPQRLGTKQQYIDKALTTNKQYTKQLSKNQLPVVGLKVTPSGGKKGENPYYYNIVLYTLFSINVDESGNITPTSFEYAEIAFKANSGSKFTFVIEGDSVASGTKLIKSFT